MEHRVKRENLGIEELGYLGIGVWEVTTVLGTKNTTIRIFVMNYIIPESLNSLIPQLVKPSVASVR